jgi:23S rRNA pseudouridine1911/1915/1917 synthase
VSNRVWVAGAADAGKRLDVFLAERLALSRAQTRRLLARGAVSLDGRPLAADAKGIPLAEGVRVEVEPFRAPEHQRALPDDEAAASLRVLAEGPGWLAVDKPPGMPVHPLREDERGTVLNAVAVRHPEIHGVGEGGLRSGVVHRLDVDTSGVLLLATREESWARLRRAFAEHRVEKVYLALVWGDLGDPAEGTPAETVEVGLVIARHRPARVRVVGADEARSRRDVRLGSLRWRALEHLGGATLLEVRPRTGFLHQIRATFAHLGHPVVGDASYGPAERLRDVPRHMLHAARAAFEEIEAEAPVPPDFAATLARLRGS